MDRSPDFYLASREGYGLETPRKCWILDKLAFQERRDLAVIEVEPPLMYRDPVQGDILLGRVAIAPRHVEASIFSPQEWPVYIHIIRLKTAISVEDKELNDSDVENIAWGELYPTIEAALNAVGE